MNYEIKPKFQKILKKLKKKDPSTYKAVMDKIKEIIKSDNPDHYKPLKYDLKNKKRVHPTKSTVLVFSYDMETDLLSFENFDHHDNVYSR
jgi:YafQ family addiction module toxin component